MLPVKHGACYSRSAAPRILENTAPAGGIRWGREFFLHAPWGTAHIPKTRHPAAVPIGACSNSGLTCLRRRGAGPALIAPGAFAALAFEHADTPSGTRIEYLMEARLRIAALAPAIFSRLFAWRLIAAEKVHGSPLLGETLSYKVNIRSCAAKLFRRLQSR